jgi:lipid-binding SYLF domain-containing protein
MIFFAGAVTIAQEDVPEKLRGAADESVKAAEVFREIMKVPEKTIPKKVLSGAECVAVFPSTIKGGFILGAQKGDGVVSCRTEQGWGAPVYLDLSGGSIGLQIGGQSTDYVFLIMNRSGIDKMIESGFTLGGEVSVAAGPVGRAAEASTDWKLNAQVLSYSRSKGLFAGASLKGVKISTDGSDMRSIYGEGYDTKTILHRNKNEVPAAVRVFPETLDLYSSRNAEAMK